MPKVPGVVKGLGVTFKEMTNTIFPGGLRKPIPNPSTFMVPCRWRRGAHACRARPNGGPKTSECTVAGGPR